MNENIQVAIEENLNFLICDCEADILIEKSKEKKILLNFSSGLAGVFTGIIKIKSANYAIELPIVVEVESKEVWLDVKIDAAAKYKNVKAGSVMPVQVSIFNFLDEEKELAISYKILDMNNNEIFKEQETFSLLGKKAFIKTFSIPNYLKEGDYLLAAEVNWSTSAGTSSFLFHVVEEKEKIAISYLRDYRIYALALIIILIILLFFFLNWKALKNIENMRAPIRIYKVFKKRETIANARIAASKLAKQKELLENAFKSKYISQEAYKKCNKRIDGMLRDVSRKLG